MKDDKGLQIAYLLGFFGGAAILFMGLGFPLVLAHAAPTQTQVNTVMIGGALLWSLCGIVAGLKALFPEKGKLETKSEIGQS